ncbi:lytic transglycosylase domain-containing protein [Aestuariivirga sp.]|uniref:lytic transglycosylase domain-containing protein n=1 Tax=Aestuariivirga sp. TaxID=2650926 RepID=UPI0025BC86CD|nr:lytic transglycosylase domain-containing protein [Aestuariivirga sp.]MCA3555204.1 lytic transglycosylase domain-containing protein [Aestuariivirga sp.]
MGICRLLRISVIALAAATAVAAPGVISQSGVALAASEPSAAAVEAAKLALGGDFAAAGEAAQRSGDAAAIKLVELIYLRDRPNDAGYQRILAFLDTAPRWPLSEALLRRAERSLYVNDEPPELTLAHFARRKPVTDEGSLALARALAATGDKAGARAQVQKVWADPEASAELEKQVSSEFGDLLTADDNKRRMWRLVYAQETNAAIRVSKRLPAEYQKAAAAAQKLVRGEKGAARLYDGLSSGMRGQLGMRYALARYYRVNQNYAKARDVLLTVPGDAGRTGDAEAWWVERRIVARRSIGLDDPKAARRAAYKISAAHGFEDGEEAVEGEFLAGWIALRFLKDPQTALGHFQRLGQIASSRSEKARAGYWTGRAHEAMGDEGSARAAYREASAYSTIYYGQLAREKIGLGKVPEEIESGKASAAAEARVNKDEVVRAFRIMERAGTQNDLYMFLWSFANRFDTTDELNAVASIVWDAGGATMAVRLAKAAAQQNVDIDSWGYPVRALPDWKQVGKPIEKPLVFALARQESEFNPNAGSKVGAQGLMQIMPGTAKLIASQHGIAYKPSQLMNPVVNVTLGAAHLGDLVADHDGSYVLTLVSYNAGPRRSREWIKEYGDFRAGQADPIDWVESIPFQETRQYVQKVMQNLHVYRSRLAPKTVRPMTADLMRGARTGSINVASTAPEAEAAGEPAAGGARGCARSSIASLIAGCD